MKLSRLGRERASRVGRAMYVLIFRRDLRGACETHAQGSPGHSPQEARRVRMAHSSGNMMIS
eukprot:7445873-Pyramimonas_sp.AAC.1